MLGITFSQRADHVIWEDRITSIGKDQQVLKGVDVSNNNGLISLKGLNVDFAIAKASEGTGFVDGDFSTFWSMMKEDKMLRGAYHFLDTSDPIAQAHVFVNKVKLHGLEADDILCADVEHEGLTSSLVRKFVNEVARLTEKNVFIYCNYDFLHRGIVGGLYDRPFWIANPGGPEGNPPDVHPFRIWTIQQYDWKGVDKDIFNGTREVWKLLANLHQKPKLMMYKSLGHLSLRQIADELDTAPSTILRLTCEHSNKAHEFSAHQAAYINNVFSGKLPWDAPVPKGIVLHYKK